MEKPTIQPGERIGRWTVQDTFVKTSKGEEMHDSFLEWYYNEHLPQKENQDDD